MSILLIIISIVLSFELFLNIFNSRLLNKNKFLFKSILKKDQNGWIQEKNKTFFYHNRYLNSSKKIYKKTNNMGFVDPYNYKFNKKFKKISLIGDNSFIEINEHYNSSFNRYFRENLKSDFHFYNFSQINYSAIQYYNYFLSNNLYQNIDLNIFLYSPSHFRRNFILHEPFRENIFTQPMYSLYDYTFSKSLKCNDYDLVKLDHNFKLQVSTSYKKDIKKYFYDQSLLFSLISDYFSGKLSTNFSDPIYEYISQYSNFDFSSRPNSSPHENLFKNLIKKWNDLVTSYNNRFLFVFSPFYYQYISLSSRKDHIFFNQKKYDMHKEDIISFFVKNNISYVDIQNQFYEIALKSTKNYFIHPKYAYLNKRGLQLVSKLLHQNIYFDNI